MSIKETSDQIRRKTDENNKAKVSVALFGQPGAGKYSLINKISGKKLAAVGVETDKTVIAATYEVNGTFYTDLPGYGTKNFPKESYFTKFDINNFDLFLCVTSGKFHAADTEFFQQLVLHKKICIFVVNKHDELWEDDIEIDELEKRKRDDIVKHVGKSVKVIFTSCRKNTGLDILNDEIKNNLDPAKRERWVRVAKGYSAEFLKEKRAACEKNVAIAAGLSAVNGINPIPGADVAVDISILVKLFAEIRGDYGLSDVALTKLKQSSIPIVGRLANNVVQYAAKEGIMLLLKQYVGKQLMKSFLKYIPWVGQAIAAGLGYAITTSAGNSYLDDCHNLANQALTNNLEL